MVIASLMVITAGGGRRGTAPVAPTEKAFMDTILLFIPYSSKVSSAEPEGWAAVVSINLSSITDSSLPPQVAKTLENDIFLSFLILIPTKSGTFAHCGLVFVNKASTDGGIALLAFAFAGKLVGGLGLSFADDGH